MSEENDNQQKVEEEVGLFKVIGSVMMAALGVQSARNRHRDFTNGRATPYIIVGIIFTVLFILVLSGIVKLIMHFAGV